MDSLTIAFARSSGPGGMHANASSTRAEVRFRVAAAEWIQPPQLREAFGARYAHRLNAKGELIVRSQRTRSQVTSSLLRLYFGIGKGESNLD